MTRTRSFYLPLAGSNFSKIYYDEVLGRAVSKFVAPEDLIALLHNRFRNFPRITNVIKMPENEVRKLQQQGFYKKIDLYGGEEAANYTGVKEEIEKLSGLEPEYDSSEVNLLYEIHCNLNIPGFEDMAADGSPSGVKLPYIVTIDVNSQSVLSIRRNFLENDPLRNKIDYFVHYKFLPGLGFYGFGLTHMIGGLSKASTSILRQLIDAGTLANLPAGFKTRGIRIRDEDSPIQPGEFRDVDAPRWLIERINTTITFQRTKQYLIKFIIYFG